jgi:hypothetical protein
MPKGRSAFDATFKVLSHDFLLVTKLSTPPLRPNLVPYLHLLERLDQGLTCRLILVSAPAGLGRTTLLSEWEANRKQANRTLRIRCCTWRADQVAWPGYR